jgi:hypothetical protein
VLGITAQLGAAREGAEGERKDEQQQGTEGLEKGGPHDGNVGVETVQGSK